MTLATPDHYVSPAGGGIHTGNQANPFSLREAQAFADQTANLNRSIVFSLAPGNYGAFSATIARGANAWVTYQAADPGNKPVFKGNGINAAISVFPRGGSDSYLKFVGVEAQADSEMAVEIENSNYVTIASSLIQGTQNRAVVGYAFKAVNAGNITLTGSTVKYGKMGVAAMNANNLAITKNDIGFAAEDGVHLGDTAGFTIADNYIHDVADPKGLYPDSHQDSVQIDAGERGVRNGTFSGNQIKHSTGQGFFLSRAGHKQTNVIDTVAITGNTISGNYGASPFQVEGKDLTISGNTISPVSPITSVVMETADTSNVRNNVFTDKFLNCATNSTQDYNSIAVYLTFGCSTGNVPAGSHDIIGGGSLPAAITPSVAPVVLLGHWSFASGNTTTGIEVDRSGSGHDGTLIGGPTSISGHADQALNFNDAKSQSVRLDPFNSVLNQGSNPYTISAWVNPSNMSALMGSRFGSGIIKSIGNGGNGTRGDFYLSVTNTGEFVFTNWQGSGNQAGGRHYVDLANPSNTTITANKWYHLVAAWDGTTNAMYINGVKQTFKDTNTDSGYGSGTYIGALVSGAARWHWTGGIDEVRIYNRALTPTEITAL